MSASGIKWYISDIKNKAGSMFIGEYTHTVDEKKRISLPAKFRKTFGRKVIATRGLDQCVFLYREDEWKQMSEKLGQLGIGQSDTRAFNRFIFGGAVELEADAMGRILIPDFLRDFADLKSKVVFAGVFNRVEIWNEKKWEEYKDRTAKQADMVAEKLGQVGLL